MSRGILRAPIIDAGLDDLPAGWVRYGRWLTRPVGDGSIALAVEVGSLGCIAYGAAGKIGVYLSEREAIAEVEANYCGCRVGLPYAPAPRDVGELHATFARIHAAQYQAARGRK